MIEQGIFFSTEQFKEIIKQCGGVWNDPKERPLVCLMRASENDQLYWAIPMGDMAHRNDAQRKRIEGYLALPRRDVRSCYYHIARTDKESLFFISDAVPIVDKYVERAYEVNGVGYVIRNPKVIQDLQRKLRRILAVENRQPNKFRQHITDVKQYLLKEIEDGNL